MKVKITSPCMAMLVYEAARSLGQNEGTLCGELSKETSKNITDSDVTITTEDVLSIHSIGALNFHDGNVKAKDNHTNIFGWFKFRRRPSLQLTVREKSIHRKLINRMNEKSHSGMESESSHVVTILIQEIWSETQSLYLWKFSAFVMKEKWFVPCKIEIVNLKATTCGIYKPYPTLHQDERSPQVTSALTSLTAAFVTNHNNHTFHMVEAVRDTGQKIVESLRGTLEKLYSVECILESACAEQEKLKQRLDDLQGKRHTSTSVDVARILIDTRHDVNTSEDSDTSESSDSAEYYGEEKANELLQDLQTKNKLNLRSDNPSNSDEFLSLPSYKEALCIANPSAVDEPTENQTSKINELEMDSKLSLESNPPPSYDPFDNLVTMAKQDLKRPPSAVPKNPEENAVMPVKYEGSS